MGATRIERKSRTAKKVMAEANYVTDGSGFTFTKIIARKPKTDKRGFPEKAGLPAPVLVKGTGTAPAANGGGAGGNTMPSVCEDPGYYTVPDVKAKIEEADDLACAQQALAAEQAGQNRTSLITWLEGWIEGKD